jgi:predicted ArsR family transcriptional regulator
MNGAEIQRMAHNLGLVHHTDQVKWLVKQILRKHKPLTKTEKMYLNYLTQPYSLNDLSAHFGCTTEGARKHLKVLMSKGLIERESRYRWTEGRHGAWAWYYRRKV